MAISNVDLERDVVAMRVAEFLRKHPPIARPGDQHDDISVLSFEIDGAKINDLLAEALTALGSPFRLAKEEARKHHLYTLLSTFKPRMIIIDELHSKGKWYHANQFLLFFVAEGTDMDQRYRLVGAANLATATGIAGRCLAGSSGWF